MKYSQKLVLIAALAAMAFAIDIAGGVSAHSAGINVSTTPTPTPTPKTSPTLIPTPSTKPSPTPMVTPQPLSTLADLQTRIRERVLAPAVKRGRIGIKIVSLNTGKVIFENDADKYFMPASNMKNFTVSTALERLGPDFRFVTSVFAPAMPDANGTIYGDLRIFGRGDVSISTAFSNGDYYKGIDELAEKIKQAGVKRIEGNVVADESYFKGFYLPGTWEVDDLQWYYGAEVSALPINDNAVDLGVMPGSVGAPCSVSLLPQNPFFQIINRCMTTPASEKRNLDVVKKLDRNIIEVNGTMPAGDGGFKGYVTVTHPAGLFIALLRQRLELKGIMVGGKSAPPMAVASSVEIAKLESPPFSIITAKTLKPSQNMYPETILWTLGEYMRAKMPGSTLSSADSSQLGLKAVKDFLKEAGGAGHGIA